MLRSGFFIILFRASRAQRPEPLAGRTGHGGSSLPVVPASTGAGLHHAPIAAISDLSAATMAVPRKQSSTTEATVTQLAVMTVRAVFGRGSPTSFLFALLCNALFEGRLARRGIAREGWPYSDTKEGPVIAVNPVGRPV